MADRISPESSKPSSSETVVNRRRFLGKFMGATAAGFGLFAASAPIAQAESKSPLTPEGEKPDPLFPLIKTGSQPGLHIFRTKETTVPTSQLLAAETEANLALFDRNVTELVSSVQKALPPNTTKIKATYQTNARDNLAYPIVESKVNLTPEIQIFTQNNDKETLEAALLITGDAVGLILDQVFDGKFSAQMSEIYSKTISSFNEKQTEEASQLFDIGNYINNPKVEVQDSTDDIAARAYARSFSLMRLRSADVINKLESRNLSPPVKEGVSLLMLTALKSTFTRLGGQILPGDLEFNEDHIRKLIKISGNKISIVTSATKAA